MRTQAPRTTVLTQSLAALYAASQALYHLCTSALIQHDTTVPPFVQTGLLLSDFLSPRTSFPTCRSELLFLILDSALMPDHLRGVLFCTSGSGDPAVAPIIFRTGWLSGWSCLSGCEVRSRLNVLRMQRGRRWGDQERSRACSWWCWPFTRKDK